MPIAPLEDPDDDDPEMGGQPDGLHDQEEDLPRLSRVEINAALDSMTAADWERVNRLAVRRCAGIAHLSPKDLRNQAVLELLDGRRFPPDVHPVIVLGNVMRSIASNDRKHAKASP